MDTLVVAISVAMAFRAYFYEPFQIPTGSMQPTLYGNHSEVATPSDKSVWDYPVLSFFKFCLTGTTYKEFRAPWGGALDVAPRGDGNVDVYVSNSLHPAAPTGGILTFLGTLFCENEMDNRNGHCRLPADVIPRADGGVCRNPLRWQNRGDGTPVVNKGDLVWCGNVKKGDFIFVNRWEWNFFKPSRGEVMIFSTTGVSPNPSGKVQGPDGRRYNLQQGTHYIKRLMGLPNETIQIRDDGKLYVNGTETPYVKPVGARGEPVKPLMSAPPQLVDCADAQWKAGLCRLGKDEYFAAGDNSSPISMSYDSRYWGPVPGSCLRGTASCVFWPIVNPRWGTVR